ncbi:HupE/UreJ family protein [Candidatus Saccharibacteria bacterium]|nr:HupE/UreJ family protein [Candidatus Saccharibacteria bacterium]
MKRLILIVTVCLFVAIPLAVTNHASAHELLPKNVIQYIKDNPEASEEQIKDYIDKNAPEISGRVKDQQDVIEIVNQDTSFTDNALDFMKLGVQHILGGIDHILFVLSFLLVFVSIKEVLKYTGTFTIAHSITLILASTGVLTLNPRLVEPVIALSIAVVAITTVFLPKKSFLGSPRAKLLIIFSFGLFHGLGFAGLLKEIQVPPDKFLASLVSFNIGIELGQLLIVAVALPFIYLLRNKNWYPKLIKVTAVVIASIAIFWMFQRIFQ